MKLPHNGKYTLEMFAKVSDPGRKKKKQKDSKTKNKNKKKKKEKNSKGNSKKNQVSDDDDDDDDENYESICNYLIKSDVGCYDLAPYPPLDNIYGQTGDVTELNDGDLCLTPDDSHRRSVIDPHDTGSMTIVLRANKDPGDLRAEMTRYYRRDDEEEDSSNYVMMHKDDLTYTLDLLFPKVGFYKLSLISGNQLVHQYLINVVEPDTTGGPFPTQGPGWRTDYQVRGTARGNLEADRKFLIQVRAGDCGRSNSGESGRL